jgi:hypothetical protein
MLLLTSEQLEAGVYDATNIDRAKKRVMFYHWSKDTIFFQNLVVLKPIKKKILIEKVH